MQVFANKERIGILSKTGNTTVKLSPSVITIGAKQYTTGNLICDTGISGAGGIDTGSITINTLYYVYAIIDGITVKLIASLSNTNPTGYTVYKKVGAFETNNLNNINQGHTFGAEVDSDWQSGTVTASWTVNANPSCNYYRDGANAIIDTNVQITNAPSPAVDLIITHPVGLTPDTSFVAGGVTQVLGVTNILDSGTRVYVGSVLGDNSTGVRPTHSEAGNTGSVNPTNPQTFAINDNISLLYTIPIQGWVEKIDWNHY